MGGVVSFIANNSNLTHSGFALRVLMICLILLTIICLVFLILNSLSKKYFENIADISKKQMQNMLDYYEKLDNLNTELKKFKHDYNNHMACVKSLIRNNFV